MKIFRLVFSLILISALTVCASAATLLVPGGELIGMELHDNSVTVAAFDETLGQSAKAAGLKAGDRIVSINGTAVTCPQDIRTALSCSDGKIDMVIRRGDKTKNLQLFPTATANGPKLGVFLKQGTSGVGTVTYYDPADGSFAALGHGVNDPTGSLLSLTEGSIFCAGVREVKKGKVGTPGQLMGTLTDDRQIGQVDKNTAQGVFGTISFVPKTEPLPVAQPHQVRTGKATIRSTVAGQALQEYSVEIVKIYPNAPERSRNLLLKVTDPQLLETTGGIVQGMSGSPIIQDGKLVGAVTHVLVNDPTTGYGIFIENMLDAAA